MPVDRNLIIQELIKRGDLTPEQAKGYGYQPPTDPGGMEILGGGYKRAPSGQLFKEGRSGSMTRVGGPTDTQIGEASDKLAGINDALRSLDLVDKQFRKAKVVGPGSDWVNTELQFAVEDLGLRLKEQPYNLGVLNGPDLALIRQIVGNPASLKTMVNRPGFDKRLRQLARILGQTYRARASQYEGVQGRPEALNVPLYQAPDSQYTKEQWGTRGLVPRNALRPDQPASTGANSGWGELEVVK